MQQQEPEQLFRVCSKHLSVQMILRAIKDEALLELEINGSGSGKRSKRKSDRVMVRVHVCRHQGNAFLFEGTIVNGGPFRVSLSKGRAQMMVRIPPDARGWKKPIACAQAA